MDLDDPATWDAPLFPISVAAVASKMEANTLRSWFQREHVSLQKSDVAAGANGLPHLFSLRSVLALAATAELVRLGEHPSSAFQAALGWTLIGEAIQTGHPAPRYPAGLYPAGYRTILISSPYGVAYRVIPIEETPGKPLWVPFHEIFGTHRYGARVVWLDFIDWQVRGVCEGYLR